MKKHNALKIIFIAILFTLLIGMVDPTEPPIYAAVTNQNVISEQRLQGIFTRVSGQFAVIDNQIVKQNDYLSDGSQVTTIAKESVIITKSNGQDEVLALPGSVRRDGN
jgi:hypothetical protein